MQSGGTSPTSVTDDCTASTKSRDESVASHFQHQRESENDSLLRIQVLSSLPKSTFYVPVSLMLQRELELQQTAKERRISSERWSSSRLYSLWKSSTGSRVGNEITLLLEPEVVMKDYSDLVWEPWLTACIREYYNTGNLRIPEDCLGSDILLALEYFGILSSSPETFIFESTHALGRIKYWSAYFSHRNAVAEWVLSDFRSCLGRSRIWTTTSNPEEGNQAETLLQVNGGTATILGQENGGRGVTVVENLPSCQVIHFLFFDNESTNKISKEAPMRMRRDFCEHLRRQINSPAANISFDIERVKITKSCGKITTALRAVLRLELRREKDELQAQKNNPKPKSNEVDRPLRNSATSITSDHNQSLDNGRHKFHPSGSPGPSEYSEVSELARILQVESSEKSIEYNEKYAVYGENDERALNMSVSGTSHPTGDDVDEQRHPYGSMPPLECNRSKPEVFSNESKMVYDANSTKQTIFRHEAYEHPKYSAPIGYLNTAFGDLQSVTSALSDPNLDEPTAGSTSSKFLVQLARRRLMADAGQPTEELQDNSVAKESYEDPAKQWTLPQRNFQPTGAFEIPQKVSENLVTEAKNPEGDGAYQYNIWEGLCGIICGGGLHEAKSTPLRRNKESETEYDFISDVIKTASMDGQAAKEWLQSKFPTDHPLSSIPDGTKRFGRGSNVNGAKVGDSSRKLRSDRFEDSDTPGRPNHSTLRLKTQDCNIPERIPFESRPRSSPDYGGEERHVQDISSRDESSLISGDELPTRRVEGTSPREQRHRTATPESDLIALKNRRQSDIHRAKTSALAMHTSRSLSHSLADGRVSLPPRQPRRASVREPIARKKLSSSGTSSTTSQEFLIEGPSRQSTISKAKVCPSGSSRTRSSGGKKMLL